MADTRPLPVPQHLRAAKWVVAVVVALAHASAPAAETMGGGEGPAGEAMPGAVPEPVERPEAEAPAEFPRTVPEGVPSLQMSSEFSSPTLAIGLYRPVGHVISRGVRLEPLTVRAWLQAGLGYDDNIGLTSTNKTSSLVFTLNPSISLGLEGRFHRYFAVYRGSYVRYTESSTANYENHNLSLIANDEWTARLRTSFQYDYIRGLDPRGATTAASVGPQPWTINTARASVAYGAAGALAGITASAGYLQRRYQDQTIVDVRDYDQYDLGVGFSYRVAPKTFALADIRRADITNKAVPSLDNVEMRYLIGARWEATAKTSATARVGYMTKDFSAPGVPDSSAPSYEIGLTWSPLTYSFVTLTGRRSFTETLELGSTSIIDNYGALAWEHVWGERIRSRLSTSYGRLNHEGIGRTDTYHDFMAQGSFRLQRWLFLGAQYRRDGRSSDIPGADYTRNVFLFTVESAI